MNVIIGRVFQTSSPTTLEAHDTALVAYTPSTGIIHHFIPAYTYTTDKALHTAVGGPVALTTHLSPTSFLMPGLIDTHIHAPQYAFTGNLLLSTCLYIYSGQGTGYDLELLAWLEK